MLARLRQSGGDLLVSSTARSHLLFATATESRLIMPTLPDPAFQKPGPSLSGLKVLHRLLHSSVPKFMSRNMREVAKVYTGFLGNAAREHAQNHDTRVEQLDDTTLSFMARWSLK